MTYPKGIKVCRTESFADGEKVATTKKVIISKKNPLYKVGLRYFSKQDDLYRNTSKLSAFGELGVLDGADAIRSFIKKALKLGSKVRLL